MRYAQRTKLVGVVLSAALVAGGCATSGVNKGDFNIVSLEEEWQLGQQLEADIAKQLPLLNDSQALAYVNSLGQQIVRQTEMANLPWRFHIVNDPAINAFNIPGGHVYVNTGLIQAADNVAEFAGVMAHEIAHGVSRHGTEQLTRAYGINIIGGILLGQNPAAYQQILAQILAGGAMARYSRGAENESDVLGVRYMYEAGYNPEGMATMFEELLQQRRSRPSSVERFFSTHPLTEDRIRNVREQANQLPDSSRLVTTDRDYQNLRQRVGG